MSDPNDRFLLIWEENPEDVKFYSLPRNEVEAEWYVLQESNGIMINSGDCDDYALKVNGFIEEASIRLDVYGDVENRHSEGKWARYRIEVSELPTHAFVGVYKSGFLL